MVRQAAEVTLCIRLRLRPPRLWLGGSAPQMASSSSTSTSTTSSAVPRALISRERVPKSNTGKYRQRGNSDPKNMSPRDRIEEFPGENLCLRRGKLFCNGCKEILSSKKSILKNHLASKKLAAGKEKLKVTKKARSCAHMCICHAKDCKTGRWTM
ncbi:unnamed protein product [Porites evermanni]|uniref:Uncharacterized protein n=1 Tax=Porites evermanni TaxID=104178 RepID=A0ABN8MMH6_9CNID|nr:unnamed protein product [Porites evermanni]